jgi:hypothetical protein
VPRTAIAGDPSKLNLQALWPQKTNLAAVRLRDIEVNLSEVSDTSFRFFEMHRFRFVQKASAP